jgi:Glycosyl hydrolases family 2, TIM barrel domain/Glycosyl hydrolases family 2/Glycosyl hydrolases family 2, sugar binding domain
MLVAAASLIVGVTVGDRGSSSHATADPALVSRTAPTPIHRSPTAAFVVNRTRGGRARAHGGGGTGVTGTKHGGTTGPPTPRPPAPIPLTSGWSYLPDPNDAGLGQSWGQGGAPNTGWASVSIPNDFNPIVTSAAYRGTVGWYRVSFTGPTIAQGRAWVVNFESVRRNAQAWLNGYPIGANHDSYASFSLPATSLKPDATNTLIVRVDNARGAGSFPEDWWNWGGIMGPVTLQPTGRMAIHDLGVTPELRCSYRCGDFRVQGTLVNEAPGALTPRIVVHVTSPGRSSWSVTHKLTSMRSGTSAAVSFPVAVKAPVALWSPSSPSLYSIKVDTFVGGRLEAETAMRVGMRQVRVAGGIFYLNGKRLWLHGAAIHEDIEGHGAALTDADVATIVAELRSVGANITRAHYLLSPRLLDALDAAGIMVWSQPPIDHADTMLRTPRNRARALSMLRSTLIADRNHPSVIVDSVGNELSSTPDSVPGTKAYLTSAIAMARQLNPQVPVGLDIYCYTNFPAQKIYKQLDAIGISSYFGWYPGTPGHSIADFNQLTPYLRLQHSRYPNQALVIAEFGAEALFDGLVTDKGTYEFQSDYLQKTMTALDSLSFMNGGIYWTLREFAVSPGWTGGVTLPAGSIPDDIHHKGLIEYNGTEKPAFAVAQQQFAITPLFVTSAGPPPSGAPGALHKP